MPDFTTRPGLLDHLRGGRDPQSRKVAHNTYAEAHADGSVGIRYHATEVVTHHADGSVSLNSGGYRTYTTKARLNEFTPDPISVYQEQFAWYVRVRVFTGSGCTNSLTFPYADGMTLRHGANGWTVDVPEGGREDNMARRVDARRRSMEARA